MFRYLNLRLEKLGPAVLFAVNAILLAGLSWLDYHNGAAISLLPLDWVPVAFAAWYVGPGTGVLFSLASVIVAMLLHVQDRPDYWNATTLIWVGLVRGASYLFMVWVCDKFRGSYFRELDIRRETQAAASRIKMSAQTLIGHEIATAVSVLQTAADLMAKDGGEGRAASLDTFRAVLSNLQASSRGFINETRMQSAHISEKFEKTDLSALIGEVVETFGPLTRQRKIAVSLSVSEGGRRVWADRAALSLVLCNLISNAIKFSKPGGRLEVKVQFATGHQGPARVEISDDGPGVAAESLEAGGGFKMIRDLLRLHNAILDVDCAPGKGSRFSFSLNEVSDLT